MQYFGLLIPILALSIPIFAIWTRHLQKIAEMQARDSANDSDERAAQYANQVQSLEERVRVLERIVTDGGYNVAAQIEALRDSGRETRAAEEGTVVPLALNEENV